MKIVQNKNGDPKGNMYWNSYANPLKDEDPFKAIACFGNRNFVFEGVPKIVLRKGENSEFGNELLLQFLIKKRVHEYPANSDHQVLEFYFNSKEGIHFLKEAIKFMEDEENGSD